MVERVKGSDGIVRHRGKGVWSRVEDKEQFDQNWDEIFGTKNERETPQEEDTLDEDDVC
jgi:hypothetical protein